MSNRTSRPETPPPTRFARRTARDAVCPEQTNVETISSVGLALPVGFGHEEAKESAFSLSPLMNGAGWTVTADWTLLPRKSRTVSVTAVAAPTLLPNTVTVLPLTFGWTGRAIESDENIWYGASPPAIVTVAGVPA